MSGSFSDPDSPKSPASRSPVHAASESSGSSDGVLVELPGQEGGVLVNIDGSTQDPNGGGGAEETFVDATEEIGSGLERGLDDSIAMIEIGEAGGSGPQLAEELARAHARLDDAHAECRKYKEERDVFGRDVVVLQRMLEELLGEPSEVGDDHFHLFEAEQSERKTQLHFLMENCSRYIIDLKDILLSKDREIQDLQVRNIGTSISEVVIESYLSSMREGSESALGRMRVALDTMIREEGLPEDASVDQASVVERKIYLLIEQYKYILYEIEQLGHYLVEANPDLASLENYNYYTVPNFARNELIELKRKEADLLQHIYDLTEKIQGFSEQAEKMKDSLDMANSELSNKKVELEQMEQKLSSTKEKLSIAVTKGKSIVQHRDSLKQSLADKVSEIERLTHESNEKSLAVQSLQVQIEELNASLEGKSHDLERSFIELGELSCQLEFAKRRVVELDKLLADKSGELDNRLSELQQSRDALEIAKDSAEKLTSLLAEKSNELEKSLQDTQQASKLLETAKDEELSKAKSLLISLQESLSEQSEALQQIHEVILQVDFPLEVQLLETANKVKWLVEKKQHADIAFEEQRRIKYILTSLEFPEAVSQSDILSQISWVASSFNETNNNIKKMQDQILSLHQIIASHELNLSVKREEIDRLTSSLSEEKQAKDALRKEHSEQLSQCNDMSEKLSSVTSEMNELLKSIAESLEIKSDAHGYIKSSELLEKFHDKLKEKTKASFDAESLEKMKVLLYVTDQELALCRVISEEDLAVRSERLQLFSELQNLSIELANVKNDKGSLQKDLERAEEKYSLIREKLSLAVKKGKGLAQERDGLKLAIDEKNSEIGKLKHDLLSKDSTIAHLNEQIDYLSTHIRSLETEIASYKDQIEQAENILKDQREQAQNLLDDNKSYMQLIVDSIEGVNLEKYDSIQGPVEKVQMIVQYIKKLQASKVHAEEELQNVKEGASMHASKLSDASITMNTLQGELSKCREDLSLCAKEKEQVLLVKAALEREIEKMKEEALASAGILDGAYSNVRSLEAALSQATGRISQLEAEYNDTQAKYEKEISALNAKLVECSEELQQNRGTIERYSEEQHGYLDQLKALVMDGSLFSLITEDFEKKITFLNEINLVMHDMNEQYIVKGLHMQSTVEFKDMPKLDIISKCKSYVAGRMDRIRKQVVDDTPSFATLVDLLNEQAKSIGTYFKDLSEHLGDDIDLMSQAMGSTKNMFYHILDKQEVLQSEVASLEGRTKMQEAQLFSLQKDLMHCSSTCSDATREIKFVSNILLLLTNDLEKNLGLSQFTSEMTPRPDGAAFSVSDHSTVVNDLLASVGSLKVQSESLANVKQVWEASWEELVQKGKQTESDCHRYADKVVSLEKDLKILQEANGEMEIKIKDYQDRADSLNVREDELVLYERALASRETGVPNLLSKDQVEVLVDRVNKLSILSTELSIYVGVDSSGHFEKLCYILDKFNELQEIVESLSSKNGDMQRALEFHVKEIEQLKNTADSSKEELELKRNELRETTAVLEKIVLQLGSIGGKEMLAGQKPTSTKAWLLLFEKLVSTLTVESESAKSLIEELDEQLKAKEKTVDDLSVKLRMLESPFGLRIPQTEIAQDKAIFETTSTATGSEISEMEDLGTIRKSAVPTAAQPRIMRKGSGEHLVLNIGADPEQLVPQENEDKGHVFKSLNTSGLIPLQGRFVADKIDSIWVSGSRTLMSQPRARLGLVAYALILHLWLFVTIL